MAPPSRTVLITGGTTGLGLHAAMQIAQKHPEYKVIICSRSNTNNASGFINKSTAQNNVDYLKLDLSSLSNVREFALDYEKRGYPPIQSLLFNAGIQFPGGVQFNDDKMEKTFATNHVGHALLFYLLRPHLAEDARIVITASGTHDPEMKTGMPDAAYPSAEELAHPNLETANKDGRQRYSTSKLCNVIWMYALHRRLQSVSGEKMTVNAYDPGLMPGTSLARGYSLLLRFVWNHVMPYMIPLLKLVVDPNIRSPQESGVLLSKLAMSGEFEGISGKYFEGNAPHSTSKDSHILKNQEDLWSWTVKRVAESEVEMRQFENFGQSK